MNIRHDLDPQLVAEQIEKGVAEAERHRAMDKESAVKNLASYAADPRPWSRKPSGPEVFDQIADNRIKQQREYYAKVRVIELPPPGKRFRLVYGDIDDAIVASGTGPFETFDEAAGWFLRGGR